METTAVNSMHEFDFLGMQCRSATNMRSLYSFGSSSSHMHRLAEVESMSSTRSTGQMLISRQGDPQTFMAPKFFDSMNEPLFMGSMNALQDGELLESPTEKSAFGSLTIPQQHDDSPSHESSSLPSSYNGPLSMLTSLSSQSDRGLCRNMSTSATAIAQTRKNPRNPAQEISRFSNQGNPHAYRNQEERIEIWSVLDAMCMLEEGSWGQLQALAESRLAAAKQVYLPSECNGLVANALEYFVLVLCHSSGVFLPMQTLRGSIIIRRA
jgi:hypothetical protein